MNRHDIVFIGQLGVGTIVPFGKDPFVEQGSPVLFAPMAASCLGKKIAALTKIAPGEESLLEPLKAAGVELFVGTGETARYRVVFETANVDQRKVLLNRKADSFALSDVPPLEPCLVHLCCIGDGPFQLELMRLLKSAGFRVSVDMQGFVGMLFGRDSHLGGQEPAQIDDSSSNGSDENT